MDKETIRSFYLSLIDNPEAEWTSEKDGDWTLYHCQINNLFYVYRIFWME